MKARRKRTKGTPANCFGIDRLGLVSIGQGALRASRIGLEGSPYATRRPDGCCRCLDKLGAVRNAQAMIDISAVFLLTGEQLFGPVADLVPLMALSTSCGFDHLWLARHRTEQLAKVSRQLTPSIGIDPKSFKDRCCPDV